MKIMLCYRVREMYQNRQLDNSIKFKPIHNYKYKSLKSKRLLIMKLWINSMKIILWQIRTIRFQTLPNRWVSKWWFNSIPKLLFSNIMKVKSISSYPTKLEQSLLIYHFIINHMTIPFLMMSLIKLLNKKLLNNIILIK